MPEKFEKKVMPKKNKKKKENGSRFSVRFIFIYMTPHFSQYDNTPILLKTVRGSRREIQDIDGKTRERMERK